MKRFLKILIISLMLYFPVVSASSLRTETDSMITKIANKSNELNEALNSFNNYLNVNKTKVANALDIDTLKRISEYLQASDYDNAFGLLESAVNDSDLTNIQVASKVNQYFSLKQELINFVKSNREALNIDTGTNEGIECSFDLLTQVKSSFNLVKPTISTTIELLGQVITETVKTEINAKNNIKNSDINETIDEYKDFASLLSTLITQYTNSLDAYAEVFEIIGGSEGLFEVAFKKKFREDLNKLLNDTQSSLKPVIDSFIANRWTKLESSVSEITESDKTVAEKNEAIYEKIDQVTEVNEKFVSAINEVIGDLDIESIKTKINLLLDRANIEFDNANKYLKDHLIVGDYDIELVSNHDSKVNINRAKEIIILDKLFEIDEFKRQLELANNLGTLEFDFGSYSRVPNKAVVRVTDNGETQKEYNIIVKGDVNGNSSVTITDAIEAAYYSLNAKELDEYQQLAADVNNSNSVTITDVYLIARAALEQGGNL